MAELSDEKKLLEQKNEELMEVSKMMSEKEKVKDESLSQLNNEVLSLKRQVDEKEEMLTKMEQERDKLIGKIQISFGLIEDKLIKLNSVHIFNYLAKKMSFISQHAVKCCLVYLGSW